MKRQGGLRLFPASPHHFPSVPRRPRATSDSFAVTVVFVGGMAAKHEIRVSLRNAGEDAWHPMSWDRGTNKWNYTNDDSGSAKKPLPVTAPISMQVSMPWFAYNFKEEVTSKDVIPVGWKPGQTYYPLESCPPSCD